MQSIQKARYTMPEKSGTNLVQVGQLLQTELNSPFHPLEYGKRTLHEHWTR